jgi:hypothetical protein
MPTETALMLEKLDILIADVRHSIEYSKVLISQSRALIDNLREARLSPDDRFK